MAGTNSLITGGDSGNINDWFAAGSLYAAYGATTRSSTTLQANVQRKVLTAHTLQHLGVLVTSSNTGIHATNWVNQINGSAGNCTVDLSGSVTGWRTDTTHTDSITAGQLVNPAFVGTSGAPDCFIANQSVTVNATSPLSWLTFSSRTPVDANAEPGSGASNLYCQVSGSDKSAGLNASITEDSTNQQILRAAGVSKGLFILVTTNTSGSTCVTRKTGVDGNQTVSPGTASGTAVTAQDTTHTDSYVATDTANYKFNPASHTMNIIEIGTEFVGTTSAQDVFVGDISNVITMGGADEFFCIGGALGITATETSTQCKPHYALTVSFYRARLFQNTKAASSSFQFRNAGAAGNGTVSFAASTTGTATDTTHTDSVVADTTMGHRFVSSAGAGSLTPSWLGVTLNDGTNTGSSTETGTAVMTFAGISFAASGVHKETSTAGMAFAGIHFVSSGARTETSTAGMAFSKASFISTGLVIKVKGTAGMAFAGISIQASGVETGPAGTGLRQFSTFG